MKRISRYLIIIAFLASVLVASAQDAEKIIRRGNRQYRKSNYAEAIAKYKEVLKADPMNTKARFNLGDAYYGMQCYDSAFLSFDTVVQITSDAKLKSDALFNMGNCLLTNGMHYDAFCFYKESLKANPKNEDALYNLEYCRAHLVKSEIHLVQPEHGRVRASAKTAYNGQRVALAAQPDPGYALEQYIVVRADDPETQVQVDSIFFDMPKFDVVVSAVFQKGDGNGQSQQQQQDQKNQDQQDQQSQDQENQDQQDQQNQQGQDEQDQDQQQNQGDQENQQDQQDQQNKGQQSEEQQDEPPQSQQMSKADAQRMLDALESQEKKTMEKVNEQKVRTQPKKKSDKDW